LCGAAEGVEHEHLVEPAKRRLVCACQACAILFSGHEDQRYKRVPTRIRFLPDFQLTDAQWDSLLVPINMAFSLRPARQQGWQRSIETAGGIAFAAETWDQIVAENADRVHGSGRGGAVGESVGRW
jgi:hypothetical protein